MATCLPNLDGTSQAILASRAHPVSGIALDMLDDDLADRIDWAIKQADLTGSEVARKLSVTRQAVSHWLQGRNFPSSEKLAQLAKLTGASHEWLTTGRGDPGADAPTIGKLAGDAVARVIARRQAPAANASLGGLVDLRSSIPLYGQAEAGRDGSFPLNGNHIQDIIAPPSLAGVVGAYAVMVVGDSMEPRYFSGETVFVNPRAPIRRNDFVVAQIAADEGEPPLAFIKRFVSREKTKLRLFQLNPKKDLEFPVARVVSVHRIVMGGEG